MLDYLKEKLDFLHELDFQRLSKYNSKYATFKKDPFKNFVLSQYPVHSEIFDIYKKLSLGKVLEIGSFIPVVPLGLKKMGFDVTTVEKTSYYGDAYIPIIQCLERNKIQFKDIDIIDTSSIKNIGKFH